MPSRPRSRSLVPFLLSGFLAGIVPEAIPSVASAQTVANFVTMTPCRIADTRDPKYAAGFGPPFMPAHSIRTFDILHSACGIPSNAIAYSLNITLVTLGPVLYLTLWPTGHAQPEVSTLNAPEGGVIANAAVAPGGTNGAINIYVDGDTNVLIDINGFFTQYVAPTPTTIQQITQQVTQQITQTVTLPTILAQSNSGTQSVALGNGASSVGTQNTAIGFSALKVVSDGIENSSLGAGALASDVHGSNNVAVGANSLTLNAAGGANTAVGSQALFNNFMDGNTGIGYSSLYGNTTGHHNTAVGVNSLYDSASGANNIAVGYEAGKQVQYNDNIMIGNTGNGADSQTIRIGTQGTQLFTYLAGVYGGGVGGSQVFVDTNGRLGTFSSARAYKKEIEDLPDTARDNVMHLRPVQFRYRQSDARGEYPLQYGLIAEEVADAMPELVERNADGEIEGVRYHLLPALLLAQLEKQQQRIASLETRLAALEASRPR